MPLAAPTVSDLAAIVKNRLKRIQYRPELITDSSPRPDSPSNPNRHNHQTLGFQRLYPLARHVCDLVLGELPD